MATTRVTAGAGPASAAVSIELHQGSQLKQPKGHVSPRGVGAQSSAFSGKGLIGQSVGSASVKKGGDARNKSTGLQVRAATETSVSQRIKFGGSKQDGDTIEVLGRLLLAKKNTLDLVDVGAVFLDNAFDMIGRKVFISLVSTELDPETGKPKKTAYSGVINWWSNDGDLVADEFMYSVNFKVPKDFGEPGAIQVHNKHMNEFFMRNLTIEYPDKKQVSFQCDSWVYPEEKYDYKDRIFFSNKDYLPSDTPAGLKELREIEKQNLRGDGTGTREKWDRIYDYDVYNDLGKPEKDIKTKRPILGGPGGEFKYPRRCRTGRPMGKGELEKYETNTNSALDSFYVPRDEAFERSKSSTFYASALKGFLHKVVPSIKEKFDKTHNEFDSFQEIFDLYEKGQNLKGHLEDDSTSKKPEENGLVLLDSIFDANGDSKELLVYPTPDIIARNKWAWQQDDEFARQFLAGLNPLVIRSLQEYPPKSTLDPTEFPGATALTDEDILCFLERETVAQAIDEKKLFIVDYRDVFLPYIDRLHASVKGLKMYAPRAIFYLTSKGNLKPIAIELSLPPKAPGEQCINQVFTPPPPGIEDTFPRWELAKIHVNSVDFGYHELVSHWSTTHAIMEPFILSTHRNISKLHPIHTLLQPLYKNTMYINSSARQSLIAANGIIESAFVTGPYSTELSAVAYDAFWRFDRCGLPNDLLARGMGEPDESQPGDVNLVVKDYPYAQDGLELWDIIKSWVTAFVNHVYGSDEEVRRDVEIQAWWNEIINVGHGDKKDEPWWPKLDSRLSLIDVISTLSWTSGPHHAAVNFGQYSYAGFMPNRSPMVRRHIPRKKTPEYLELIANPEKFILSTVSPVDTTTIIMTTIELLSTHSTDEEYLGMRLNDHWTSDPKIQDAFKQFSNKLEVLKENINKRNADKKLINRRGLAGVPYTLLYPDSESGVTGQGVPYSISI